MVPTPDRKAAMFVVTAKHEGSPKPSKPFEPEPPSPDSPPPGGGSREKPKVW
jgi:hypothetical protein